MNNITEDDKNIFSEFDHWGEVKKGLHNKKNNLLFKEGQIWWCSLGKNISEEIYGKGVYFRRPVLIIKKLSKNTCIVLPLTSKEKTGTWYTDFMVENKKIWVYLNQIRFISADRLSVRISELPESDYIKVKKSLAELLNLLSS